jgi:tetraacyldisaccharide 4'-kinase
MPISRILFLAVSPKSNVIMSFKNHFRKAPTFWERRGPTSLLLWPLSWAYGSILRLRKMISDLAILNAKPITVPVIIVGNIRVGGTGKTPIVIALAEKLAALGWKPGIISRGYGVTGAHANHAPMKVTSESDPNIVGDEPVLIAKRTENHFPIWVYPKRQQTIAALLARHPEVNVIISDDGLQHAGLSRWPAREGGRDIEFVVRDERGEGNRFLLPAGPLRELATRDRDATLMTSKQSQKLAQVDEYFQGRRAFNLNPQLGLAYQLNYPNNQQALESFAEQYLPKKIAAVAALGNPQRFFSGLQKHGVVAKCFPLPDHSTYTAEFFNAIDAQCILITEKDAVKCTGITDERIWVVPMSVNIPDSLSEWMRSILQRPDPNQYTL